MCRYLVCVVSKIEIETVHQIKKVSNIQHASSHIDDHLYHSFNCDNNLQVVLSG